MSSTSEKKRNQRKSPLTPKKGSKKEDSPPAIAMRVGGRVKKAKIPFDPSDAMTKRRQTDSFLPMKRLLTPVQQHCVQCKKVDKPEMLINCKGDCTSRIHLICMQSTCERFGKNEELTWECFDCQSCSRCHQKGTINGKRLLKCYICFNYYHPKCFGSEDKIKIIRENRFDCGCSEKTRKTVSPIATAPRKARAFTQIRVKPVTSDISNDSKIGFLGFNANEDAESSTDDEDIKPTDLKRRRTNSADQSSTKMQQRFFNDKRNSIADETNIPDASKWSSEEVFKYFQSKFPRHANVFKEQEIDGPSLYLLKRRDIVQGFKIQIGPALKIYELVLKLQTKCSDPFLSWQ